MAINSCVFSGNVTADPVKRGDSDNPVLSFSVAVNVPKYSDGKWVTEPLYVSCSIFGKRAKTLGDIIAKGMALTVQGSLRPDEYDSKDGTHVKGFSMNVLDIQLPPKQSDSNGW